MIDDLNRNNEDNKAEAKHVRHAQLVLLWYAQEPLSKPHGPVTFP
jgi:hypothetical protein